MTLRPSRAALRLLSDERLVELARQGHESAFEAIFERYRGRLLRFSAGILPASRAEDAVQQAFLAAHRELTGADRDLALGPWLFRVTRNACLDALRQNGWDHEQLDPSMNGVERPEQALARKESLRDVVGALGELPDSQREAIVLRELEGRSHEEIAAELGVSPGAVRQLIHRGRKRLRNAVGALFPAPLIHHLVNRADGLVRAGELGAAPISAASAGNAIASAGAAAGATAGAGGGAAALKLGAAAVVAVTLAAPTAMKHSHDSRDGNRVNPIAATAMAAPAEKHPEGTPGAARRLPAADRGRLGRRRMASEHQPTREVTPRSTGGALQKTPRLARSMRDLDEDELHDTDASEDLEYEEDEEPELEEPEEREAPEPLEEYDANQHLDLDTPEPGETELDDE